MTRALTKLTDEQLAYIASAAPEMPTIAIARHLGAAYFTVAHAVRRIRRHGWYTKLHWTTCATCGGPICYAESRKRAAHPGQCTAAYLARRQREKRKGPHRPSTEYVNAWRKREPDRSVALREQEKLRTREKMAEWTPEQWAPLLDRLHAADRRDYELTKDLAESSGTPWTGDEDQYVWEHLQTPAREVGLALGRSLWAVRNRRVILRRRQANTPSDS